MLRSLKSVLGTATPTTTATLTTTVQPYDGLAAIPAGTEVELLSQDASNAHIRYSGHEYIVPISMLTQSK